MSQDHGSQIHSKYIFLTKFIMQFKMIHFFIKKILIILKKLEIIILSKIISLSLALLFRNYLNCT